MPLRYGRDTDLTAAETHICTCDDDSRHAGERGVEAGRAGGGRERAERGGRRRAKLAGMNHCQATLPPPPAGAPPAPADAPQLAAAALPYMHASVVLGRAADDAAPTARLAAAALHDGRPMLAMLVAQPDGAVALHVHADDAIGGNILLKELQAGLRGGA